MDVDKAFTRYVAQRRLQLFRTACLLCGDPHQAEDIVQDALARLYAAWPRASRADNIDGYVRRAIVNSHLESDALGRGGSVLRPRRGRGHSGYYCSLSSGSRSQPRWWVHSAQARRLG